MTHRSRQRRAVRGATPLAAAGLITAALLLAAAGCAPRRGGPPAPFYTAAPSSMREVDASAVRGKRVVIDPGHGGVFRGALGRAGLAEADVNLGVGLYLWGLLRDAGAEALLTRSSDVDFVEGVAGDLRQDLSRRTEIAASFRPDLFVSLHHNADLSRSEDKNQVETYFKMLDDGPSRDVAELVHGRLQERLQIAQGSVVPGNYFVVRNAPCAAVLGEPSYITNPWVEDKLRLAEKQLLEAQAYFLGIVEYFSRGAAAIASLAPRDTVVSEPRPWLVATPAVDRSAVDSSSVKCELDGRPVSAAVETATGRLVARPETPLSGGRHEFCFAFRNEAGNSSGRVCASFDADPAPAAVSLKAEPSAVPKEGGVLVTAAVLDARESPVRDGTPVVFSASAGELAGDTVVTAAGVASTFFFGDERTETAFVRATSRGLTTPVTVTDSVALTASGPATTCLSVSDARTGEPLAGASVLQGDSLIFVTTPQGLAVVAGSAEGLAVMSAGYVPALIATEGGVSPSPREIRAVRMRRAALGVLHGVSVTLDPGAPAVETASRAGEPREGVRVASRPAATSLTERVTSDLAALLRGAGARVLLLEPETPDEEKVARSERFGAQRYLRIEVASDNRGAILHYPDSRSGAKLAAKLAAWWDKVVPKAGPRVAEDAHYVLRQTSSPAAVARIAAASGVTERAAALMTAYAFYLAVLEDAGLDASLLVESSVRAGGSFTGEAADMVLDGFVRVPLSEDGTARFFCEEGVHMVTVESKARRTAPHFVTVMAARKMDETAR